MSTTSLKLLALITMTIDHIGQFIPSMPIYFRWIGRISGPLFIFCTMWGFYYTSNRKKYLVRMYLAQVLMAFMNLYLNNHMLPNYDQYMANNIFVTLFLICIIIAIIECMINTPHTGRKYLLLFSIWQLLSTVIIIFSNSILPNSNVDYLFYGAIFGNIFFNEGGVPFILLGLLLYFCKNNKKLLLTIYPLFCITYFTISFFSIVARTMHRMSRYLTGRSYNPVRILMSLSGFDVAFITPISMEYFLTFHFGWAMLFALPFMLIYNNQKGKGLKYLFYLFYPIHILILYCIGNLLSMIQ